MSRKYPFRSGVTININMTSPIIFVNINPMNRLIIDVARLSQKNPRPHITFIINNMKQYTGCNYVAIQCPAYVKYTIK